MCIHIYKIYIFEHQFNNMKYINNECGKFNLWRHHQLVGMGRKLGVS